MGLTGQPEVVFRCYCRLKSSRQLALWRHLVGTAFAYKNSTVTGASFGAVAWLYGTLDRDNQAYVLKHAGFDRQQLAFIRTSITVQRSLSYSTPSFATTLTTSGVYGKEFAHRIVQKYDADMDVRDADKDIIFNNLAGDTD
ncbi:hypothetical protein B0H66DRAFT_624685 [Apodospora peruviana]|uniref:Uncharacterized protein n=1 Tax=Apodospora peruviana TaxID=516989 RepID=A0AAE0M1U1_9PEZI|nr:hypothetical protein B0H66DRAFT_624685 [Apodospora peruviana]